MADDAHLADLMNVDVDLEAADDEDPDNQAELVDTLGKQKACATY